MRFAELQRAVNEMNSRSITSKMLTQELREMEADGLIRRKVYPQVPPKVEYSLTTIGRKLKPVVEAMSAWGLQVELSKKFTENLPGLSATRLVGGEMVFWPKTPTWCRLILHSRPPKAQAKLV